MARSRKHVDDAGPEGVDPGTESHRLSWAVQRVCWGVLLVVTCAAVAGFLGPGPFSYVTVPIGDAELSHERILHFGRSTDMTLRVPDQGAAAPLEVWVSNTILESVVVEAIEPSPSRQVSERDGVSLVFEAGEPGPRVVTLRLEPMNAGGFRGRVEVGSGSSEVSVFVLP